MSNSSGTSSSPAPAIAADAYLRLRQQGVPGTQPRIEAARARAKSLSDVYSAMDWAFESFTGFHFREGHTALEEAIRRAPEFLPARWLHFQYPLDPSPASEAEQIAFVERWREGLSWFEQLDFRRPGMAAQVWGCVGSNTPFYLHYVEDAVPEMRRYGQLVARMMAVLDPGLPPRPMRTGRRKIVVISAHLREHTVARLFLPLFEGLDRERFELHFLDLEPGGPDWQNRLAAVGARHGGPRMAPQWRQLLAALQPDVIVYPEIGMHPMHQGLAALRLAPVQVCLWGHPVTSGFPSIDFALVPDALEPADATAHYHERLIRLPGLGHGLAPSPVRSSGQAPQGVRREHADSLEILCAQTAFKILPAQDEVFAKILQALPQARLHLMPLLPEERFTAVLERMRPVFEREGVDIDTRVITHVLMPLERYQAMAAVCDFGLDTIGWSGGMSALDLLPQGLPIIAVEGQTMRSRQTAALLKWLDMPELIARDTTDMVQVAARLGNDSSLRTRLRQQLQSGAARLFASTDTQRAFADFLASVQPRHNNS